MMSFFDQRQAALGKHCCKLDGVLDQPFVAQLCETQLAFENPEEMIHLGSET